MRQTASVAIACCRAAPDAPAHELYPDTDSDLLVDKLNGLGLQAAKFAWDDESVDWAARSAVVIRSTWDSVDRPDAFLRWTEQVSAHSRLMNAASIVGWNLNKRYLRDLETEGIPTIPTLWVQPGDSWNPPAPEFIVKPGIASGARNTARYSEAMRRAANDHVTMLGDAGQTVLIQQYLPSIESSGESSLIYIDGRLSHAIRKGGFLNLDEGILEKPWERMTYLGECEPSPAEVAVANRTFAVAQQRSVEPLLYGRVDLVADAHGELLVIEMELVDPFLSLGVVPCAADDLARAIARAI